MFKSTESISILVASFGELCLDMFASLLYLPAAAVVASQRGFSDCKSR